MAKESFIISCIRRLREYGEGMVMADQSISSLKETAKSNVYTILCLCQRGPKDRREAAGILGLNPQQAETTRGLEPGEGIVQLAGRFPYPLLLKFPYVKAKYISDKEIDRLNKNDEFIQSLIKDIKPRHKSEETTKRKEEVDDKIKDVLLDIYYRFDIASNQRAKDLGLSAQSSVDIYKLIEKEQFADPIHINLSGQRGGLSKYHLVTNRGANYIKKPPIERYSGGTGAKHIFLQKYLKKHLPDRGFKEIEIEKELSGKRIDLFCKYREQEIAIEICVSTIKTEYLNVKKDLDKCDLLLILCPDKKTKDKLEKELYQKIPKDPKINICIVHQLLNKPESQIIF